MLAWLLLNLWAEFGWIWEVIKFVFDGYFLRHQIGEIGT